MKQFVVFFFGLIFFGTASLSQQGEVAPGNNLVIEGVPKIPIALVEAVSRYTNFRSATLSSWHPAQREMLIQTRFADSTQIHQLKMPGGARTQLTFFADGVRWADYQPQSGPYFVFGKDVGGSEDTQTYRFDLDTGKITLLTDGKSRNARGIWSNTGDRLVYGSTRRNGKDVDFYVMRPAGSPDDRLLAKLEGGGWSPSSWSPDDTKLLATQHVSVTESHLWIFDVASGTKQSLTSATPSSYSHAVFSKDGKGIYTITDSGSEFRRLAYMDLSTKEHRFLTNQIQWDIEEFALSNDGNYLAYVANEEGRGILHLMETSTRKEIVVSAPLSGIVSGLHWHPNSRDLGFNLASPRSPSDVYSLDVTTGQLSRWTASETGGLNTQNFSEAELIRWKSFDGKSIPGYLFRPPSRFTGKRPVIINIHGGPEGQFRPRFLGPSNYYLNELGITLIYPNVRGSLGYGKTYVKLDDGFLREDSYKDIAALLDWIKSQPDLDSERVMVTGASYGGHMTLAVATWYSNRIRCAVGIVGPSNLATLLKNTRMYRQDLRRVEYGDERDPKMLAFLERIAPANHSDKITKPLFVAQGMNDPRVPLSESAQMVSAARKNGTPVWYLVAKDEGHGFAKKKNSDYLFYATVLFVQTYLLK